MYLYLVAIAWVYVVLLMAMTEQSVVAGIMTFLLYCVVPLSIILYLMGTPQRKRRRLAKESTTTASTPPDAAAIGAGDPSGIAVPPSDASTALLNPDH